jgi:hypothetical protein
MTQLVETEIADEGSKQDSRGRRIVDDAHWEEVIRRYQASGLTQAQFARREGIKYHTLVGRLVRHRRKNQIKLSKPKFLEARLPTAPQIRLEATLPCGLVVRGDDEESLARLIRLLRN